MVNDLENRLDDFFGSEAKTAPPPTDQFSIEKLKSLVLSIDWEITDECLTELITEAEHLLPHFEADPITHALLRMLRALARYIRKRKAQSHQDAIKRVMSVFASFETLANDKQMDEQQKKKIVAKEIQAFKKLKEQVEGQSTSSAGKGAKGATDLTSLLEHHQFKKVMSAVEERLNAEVKALKVQMQTLQKELDAMRKS
jgi:hypothetical protein